MLKKLSAVPTPGSRRTYLTRRDKIAGTPAEVNNALAVLMSLDMQDIASGRGNATCTQDDLARTGWDRADIAALGDAARAHLMAGPMADELAALEKLAA